MTDIDLVIYGEPVAQGRPKFSTAGGFARAYDPAKSRAYKDYIRLAAAQQMQGQAPLDGALALSIKAYFSIPKSTPKKIKAKMLSGELWHTKKADIDNIAKIILDALSGIVYPDDKNICVLGVIKKYGDVPKIEVSIQNIKDYVRLTEGA